MKKYQSFLSQNFQFLEVNLSIYLNRRVFVMRHKWIKGNGYTVRTDNCQNCFCVSFEKDLKEKWVQILSF